MTRKYLLLTLVAVLTLWAASANARVLDIKTLHTPAGLNVWLVEDHSVPVISLQFAFASGAAHDPYAKQGVTQLLSNMLDEGAGNLDATTFQSRLRDHAIDLSFSGGREAFSGSLRTLKRHLPLAADLLRLSLTAPRFDAEPLERMRAANMTRIRASLSNPRWLSARLLNEAMYAGHPYAANSGGTLESLEGLSAQDLRLARARHFARERLYIGIAGDITPDEAMALADMIFSRLPQKSALDPIANAPFNAPENHLHYNFESPQTNLSMAWPGIGVNDPDYYAASVLTYVFGGGGFSSRLMQELRERRGLTYGVYASQYQLPRANRMVLDGSMLPENIGPALAAINDITQSLMTTPIDAETLAYAQDYLTGSLPIQFSSSASIASTLVALQLDGRPATTLDTYETAIRAVTPVDIQRVARRIFNQKPVIITVGATPVDVPHELVTTIPNTETTAQ